MISQLGKVDAYLEQGKTVVLAIMKAEVNEMTYNIWRQEYGGMSTSQQNGDT